MVFRDSGEMTKVESFVRFEKENELRCAKLFPGTNIFF